MDITFKFIGWNTEGTSDKIWGYFVVGKETAPTWPPQSCYIFWGARGKTMNFKKDVLGRELRKLESQKENKGYVQITEDKLLKIWPNFYDNLEGRLSFCMLASKIRNA